MQRTLTALTCLLLSAAFAQASSTSSGVSRDFNPAISVNGLILYASGLVEATEHDHDALRQDGHEHAHGAAEGLQIQETELQLTASIDPYARANVVFAMHGTSGVDLEEGYLQVLTVPRGLGLRAGTFLWEFGKHNSLHTHQYPFVEKPVAWTGLLGTHGLAGTAVELSWLSPLPWYAELLATTFPLTETVHGDHEIPPNSWGQALRLRQFWDLGERATLGAGLSWLRGDMVHAHNVEQRQEAEEGTRYFFGADLTWKWTGTGANPRQLELQGEWLRRRDVLPDDSAEYDGVYFSARARVSRRIWLGGRLDVFHPPQTATPTRQDEHADGDVTTWTASLALVPSEFQAWRVDWLYRSIGNEEGEHGIRAQVNFSIGSHPAHRY